MASNGVMTLGQQTSFLIYLVSNINNVTGNGTNYKVAFDSTFLDKNANLASSSFTADNTGIYLFNVSVSFQGNTIANAQKLEIFLVTTQKTYKGVSIDPVVHSKGSGQELLLSFSTLAPMTATDNAAVHITVSGLAGDTVGIIGGNSPFVTFFSGALLS
jgi:hypothetical protein